MVKETFRRLDRGWGDAADYEKTNHAFGGGATAEPAIPQREIEMCGEGVRR